MHILFAILIAADLAVFVVTHDGLNPLQRRFRLARSRHNVYELADQKIRR